MEKFNEKRIYNCGSTMQIHIIIEYDGKVLGRPDIPYPFVIGDISMFFPELLTIVRYIKYISRKHKYTHAFDRNSSMMNEMNFKNRFVWWNLWGTYIWTSSDHLLVLQSKNKIGGRLQKRKFQMDTIRPICFVKIISIESTLFIPKIWWWITKRTNQIKPFWSGFIL